LRWWLRRRRWGQWLFEFASCVVVAGCFFMVEI
jgi:hypothetical protein